MLSFPLNPTHYRVDSLRCLGRLILRLYIVNILSLPFQQLQFIFLFQILLHESDLKQHEALILEAAKPALLLILIGMPPVIHYSVRCWPCVCIIIMVWKKNLLVLVLPEDFFFNLWIYFRCNLIPFKPLLKSGCYWHRWCFFFLIWAIYWNCIEVWLIYNMFHPLISIMIISGTTLFSWYLIHRPTHCPLSSIILNKCHHNFIYSSFSFYL